jgi:hypothetical protein
MNTLAEILREQVPHPVGSPANAVVRDRILARFRAIGYEPEIQRAYSCGGRTKRSCATVENILVLPKEPGDIVLGVAHYDSRKEGPGTSDDGQGVAAMLNAADVVLYTERTRNPIGFLITDGEEAGLLGAEAFVKDPRSANVRAVVNVEMRGTSGPSYLFETSPDNRDLVPLFRKIPEPVTSSLFYTVYSLMPNDTDVSVFKRAKKICVNFAGIGGVEHYHQATDTLTNVDVRTLQHHCDNAVAMLLALGNADLRTMRRGNAVYFDILGFFLVWWPEGWTIWIALASLVILIVTMRGRSSREIAMGAVMFLVAILVAAVIGIVLMNVFPRRLTYPAPLVAAMWIVGILTTLALTRGRSWHGRALLWHIIAIALALTLPGVSFLFLVPAIAMHLRPLVAAPVTALIYFPIGLVLYTALGALALPAIAVLMAIFATTID